MNKQTIEDTTSYVRKELKRIAQEMLWADGAQEETLLVRREKLQAELRRLETPDSDEE
jgi:hypothetical protein